MLLHSSNKMFCNFILKNNVYKCSKCGIEISTNDEDIPIFPCSAININSDQPDFIKELRDLSTDILDKTINNEDIASDDEIERRFKICESCEFFKNSICSQCGCPVNRTRNYINKLSLVSEQCPMNRW